MDEMMTFKPVETLNWLFLDLNSFFASVEQQEDPALRGRPVAVVPMETDSTCAIAASYEAKAYGIKTGTKIFEAKKMCPDLVCVLARHDQYVRYHKRIFAEVENHIRNLPLWQGEEACLHLMSVISPLADDLALVHSPLLPAAFYQLLRARGIRMVEGDAEEFAASTGLSLNVLPTAPREIIAVAGFPKTLAAMEAAGCTVVTFEADALCIACEGGPTCLTRPVLRGHA